MKTCTKCGETKPLSDYHSCNQAPDGRKPRCKLCRCAEAKQWRKRFPERERAVRLLWQANNPELLRKAKTRWRLANPEKQTAGRRDYRYRRKAEKVKTAETTARIAVLLTEPCAYCGTTENITVDHIVPLTRGGKHEASNLAPACRSCNSRKGARLLSELAV